MWHWLLHVTGVDTQQSPYYDFFSGIGPVLNAWLPWIAAGTLYLRHRNCARKGCWRLGHIDPDTHHPACRKHHSHRHKLG